MRQRLFALLPPNYAHCGGVCCEARGTNLGPRVAEVAKKDRLRNSVGVDLSFVGNSPHPRAMFAACAVVFDRRADYSERLAKSAAASSND